MRVQILLCSILGVVLASNCSSNSEASCSLDDDNVGLLQQQISVHDIGGEGAGKTTWPEWFPKTDECFIEYCQTWKDLREYFCCGSLPKEDYYCTEDPGNPNKCEASDSMASQCEKHAAEYGLSKDAVQRFAPHRRYLYSHKCGGYKVTMSSSCSTCGAFTQVTMEEGVKAWNDRTHYRYRYIPQMLIGATMFRGCHKCSPVGTVFTFEDVVPGRKVCAWGERAHLYRHGRFPKTLLEEGWTQVADESMVWEFSPTWQIPVDIFCKNISEGGTITLPATQGNVFVGGFAIEADCDWDCYLNRYPTVKAATGGGISEAKTHWELHGKDEGRICTCPPADCDWDCYLQRYPDVAKVVGVTNTLGGQKHFEQYGASEGRDCSCTGSLWAAKVNATLTDT